MTKAIYTYIIIAISILATACEKYVDSDAVFKDDTGQNIITLDMSGNLPIAVEGNAIIVAQSPTEGFCLIRIDENGQTKQTPIVYDWKTKYTPPQDGSYPQLPEEVTNSDVRSLSSDIGKLQQNSTNGYYYMALAEMSFPGDFIATAFSILRFDKDCNIIFEQDSIIYQHKEEIPRMVYGAPLDNGGYAMLLKAKKTIEEEELSDNSTNEDIYDLYIRILDGNGNLVKQNKIDLQVDIYGIKHIAAVGDNIFIYFAFEPDEGYYIYNTDGKYMGKAPFSGQEIHTHNVLRDRKLLINTCNKNIDKYQLTYLDENGRIIEEHIYDTSIDSINVVLNTWETDNEQLLFGVSKTQYLPFFDAPNYTYNKELHGMILKKSQGKYSEPITIRMDTPLAITAVFKKDDTYILFLNRKLNEMKWQILIYKTKDLKTISIN